MVEAYIQFDGCLVAVHESLASCSLEEELLLSSFCLLETQVEKQWVDLDLLKEAEVASSKVSDSPLFQ